jgi:septation ring formation regulator EzrA
MNYNQLNDLTRKYLVSEGGTNVSSIRAYLMALKESLDRMKPSTGRDKKNLTLAVDHLKEVRRGVRRLEEEVKILQEQVTILEENKSINEN